MKTTKLGSIVSIKKGEKHSKAEIIGSKSKRLITIEDLRSNSELNHTNDLKGPEVIPSDIIIVWDGANSGLTATGLEGFIGSTLARLRIKDLRKFSPKFLACYLKSQFQYLQNTATGAAIPHVNRTALENLKIPEIVLDGQIKIATLLSKVESLIAKRKKSITDLDELLKSTFLEMFGDPVRNQMMWEKKPLSEVASSRLGKMRDKKFITGKHLRPYLGNSNVLWFDFALNDLLEMDFNKKERAIFLLQYGDLLVCEGGEIGRCAIWKNQLAECYFQKALHRVRVKKTLRSEFLQYVFWYFANYGGFRNVSNKATISHLTGEKLKETQIPIPPLKLQNQFAAIVEKVESIKKKYQKSLNDLESLYGALSQKAFKGELDLSRIPLVHELKPKDITTGEPQLGKPSLTVQDDSKKEPASRDQALHQLFQLYISDLKTDCFSLDDFWIKAEEKFMESMDEEDPPLGMNDYDQVKKWLFELLAAGKALQVFNEDENRMEIHMAL